LTDLFNIIDTSVFEVVVV